MLATSNRRPRRNLIVALFIVAGIMLAGCSAAEAPTASAPTSTQPPAVTAADSPGPPPTQPEASATPAPTAAPTEAMPAAGDRIRLVAAPDGNEARYRVREQLANLALPSDAVGVTSAVSGQIVLNPDGTIVSEESKFVVDLTTLQSDQSRRDNYIRNNTLETRQFPTAEFVPAQAAGLPTPLPTSGEVTFQLVGDLTLHGVTRQVTWDVTAQVIDGRELAGTAATRFTFGEFGLEIPRVASVLSVEDNIRLEMDFRLVAEGA